jgi:hypothetical protein
MTTWQEPPSGVVGYLRSDGWSFNFEYSLARNNSPSDLENQYCRQSENEKRKGDVKWKQQIKNN